MYPSLPSSTLHPAYHKFGSAKHRWQSTARSRTRGNLVTPGVTLPNPSPIQCLLCIAHVPLCIACSSGVYFMCTSTSSLHCLYATLPLFHSDDIAGIYCHYYHPMGCIPIQGLKSAPCHAWGLLYCSTTLKQTPRSPPQGTGCSSLPLRPPVVIIFHII